ncbi:hypothetical protein FQN54_007926 [Arachnomyces sp. PD_36]|nr:hypothetical protein FQN54_007926 [Arachnomyces sp. PD_36]
MDGFEHCCNICGAYIGSQDAEWMNEYIALYTFGHEWFKVDYTGVGYMARENLSLLVMDAPEDKSERAKGQDESLLEIAIMPVTPFFKIDTKEARDYLKDTQSSHDSHPWGFFFHENCWKLLDLACDRAEGSYLSSQGSLEALMRICMSFPYIKWVVDWGHDYGGIWERYPDRNTERGTTLSFMKRNTVRPRYGGKNKADLYHQDPLDIHDLDKHLRQPLWTVNEHVSGVDHVYKGPKDCFAIPKIPREIRDMILCFLPTRDVLNLFLSSRIFATSLLPQSFWASRFHRGMDFPSILEQRGGNIRPGRDWRSLYGALRREVPRSPYHSFHNRKRIWELILPLADALMWLSKYPMVHGARLETFFQNGRTAGEMKGRVGGLVEGKNWFGRGCRVLFARHVVVPQRVVRICVSRVPFCGVEFVAGIRFIDGAGGSTGLGYIIPEKEAYRDVDEFNGLFNGLLLAYGDQGILAVAAVMESGRKTDWIGNPSNLRRGILARESGGIRGLVGEFDVSDLSRRMEDDRRLKYDCIQGN